jgi:hypothetical protein
MGGLWTATTRHLAQWVTIGVFVIATASTLVAFNDGFGAISSLGKLTAWGTQPNSLSISLGAALNAHRVRDVYAGYWVAYDLEFVSSGRVTAMSFDSDRNLAEAHTVQTAARAGWVFVRPTEVSAAAAQFESDSGLDPGTLDEATLVAWLDGHHISYTMFATGPFTVVVPARNVLPPQV